MKNLTSHTGKLKILKQLRNSCNGNPRYLAAILDSAGTGFSFKTRPDSMSAYALPNYDGKPVCVTLGTYYGVCTLASIAEKPGWMYD